MRRGLGAGRSALLRKFLTGEARLDGDGSRFLNQVHRGDIAAALVLLADLPNEGIGNVVDDEPITQRATYAWMAARLGRALQAAAEKGIPFVVLDRPDPITGDIIEGGTLDTAYRSFVGLYPIPSRYGLTLGELAGYLNATFGFGPDLTVIRLSG